VRALSLIELDESISAAGGSVRRALPRAAQCDLCLEIMGRSVSGGELYCCANIGDLLELRSPQRPAHESVETVALDEATVQMALKDTEVTTARQMVLKGGKALEETSKTDGSPEATVQMALEDTELEVELFAKPIDAASSIQALLTSARAVPPSEEEYGQCTAKCEDFGLSLEVGYLDGETGERLYLGKRALGQQESRAIRHGATASVNGCECRFDERHCVAASGYEDSHLCRSYCRHVEVTCFSHTNCVNVQKIAAEMQRNGDDGLKALCDPAYAAEKTPVSKKEDRSG